MKRVLITVLVIVAVLVAAFGLAIALGGPGEPLVMVKPEMVAFEAKFSNTREGALPLTARFAAPGPLMVTLWLI